MYTYEKSVHINTDVDTLFEFHRNPDNLTKISPDNINVKLVSISQVPVEEGTEIKLLLSKFFVKQKWNVRIKECEHPRLIVDEQTKGPFKYWLHYHIFKEAEGGSRMIDKVEYIPPFGAVGKLFLPVIKLQLDKMFTYRHEITKKLLGND